MLQGINEYLLTKWDIEVADEQKTYKISLELAYNNYVNWEKSGGKDLQLPGFFLTNRQMFWVANAHKDYSNFILITKIV